jgi:hypothetical protein
MGRDDWGKVKNVQYKTNQNCYYESPLYNEYILIKIIKKSTVEVKLNFMQMCIYQDFIIF